MSSDTFALEAEKRQITGKKVQSIRDDGFIPAVVYEKGKESINVRVPYMPLLKAYQAVGMAQPIELSVEKKKYLTMIKDVHMDPVKHIIMHVAFHAVNANDPVEAEIPVHIEGDVPAEQQGNFIVRPNDHVTAKALPTDLPEFFTVSAETLIEPGDSITVADIKAIPKVEILSEETLTLAIVEEPKVVEDEPEEAEAVDVANIPSAHGGDEATSEEAKTE